jgi:pyruvate,water dikinase
MSGTWQAPGRGRWEQDAEHVPGAITPYLFATSANLFAGMADGMRRYGMPLEGFDTALVAGRLYGRARPIGANPDRPGSPSGPPPALVLKLAFRLHPELRRRSRAAAETLRIRRWRIDAARWRNELEPTLRARNVELGRVDPGMLDDAQLAAHLERLDAAYADGFRLHGDQFGAYAIPIGMWVRRTLDWTGEPPERVLEALRGSSPASAASIAAIDRIAAAIGSTDEAADILARRHDDPAAVLAELAARSPALAGAIAAWLAEDGYRPITGVDLIDQIAREMPGVVLDAVAARMAPLGRAEIAAEGSYVSHADIDTSVAGTDASAASSGRAAAITDTAAVRLRDLVPGGHRPEYDELLADARLLFGIRDDDVWVTTQWPQGMLRWALLEAGRRLFGRGAIDESENVFDTLPGEASGLLRGSPSPSAEELARRTAERHGHADANPPLAFGEDPGMPDGAALPPAIAEIMAAMAALREIDARAAAVAAASPNGHHRADLAPDALAPERRNGAIHGLGVSSGRYSGRARVVLTPPDFDRIEAGDILVARMTSPAYNVLLPLIGAVVTDRGGLLSHAALVAREFGIPAVVNTTDATSRIADGSTITVDAARGLVLPA